ncbi:PRC-barrel domain containing protein [Sandarakinorhabdus sp.]|uniref:PRC-barrel domain containing protein n=1 Tax=Sandarakinorhabdus sp. TaxID=1916663 RepID=UPI003F729C17
MNLPDIAGWVAPAATMVAAMMTAANLGARLTGWGFVVFTFGSIGWVIVGLQGEQMGLVVANGVLTLVNLVGIWRWLGREARYQAVGEAVEAGPAAVLPTSGIFGREIIDAHGHAAGKAVEAIVDCNSASIRQIIIRSGGVGGVGERMVALEIGQLALDNKVIRTLLTAAEIAALPAMESGAHTQI